MITRLAVGSHLPVRGQRPSAQMKAPTEPQGQREGVDKEAPGRPEALLMCTASEGTTHWPLQAAVISISAWKGDLRASNNG